MSSCVFGPQATRASGENFHRRQGLLPTDMVFSPVIARGCTSSLGSWTQWFSLPFPINSAGMTRGSDVRSSSPTSRRASLSSPLGTRVSGEIFTAVDHELIFFLRKSESGPETSARVMRDKRQGVCRQCLCAHQQVAIKTVLYLDLDSQLNS